MKVRLKIHWPAVLLITAVLYLLTIVFIPFNPAFSTICLFAIIAFWSRIPGVGMPSPLLFLYFMDVIDFFSVVIAINIGGMEGGIFSLFINLSTRFCGVFPEWISTIKDSFAQFISCLLLPAFLPFMGHNIEYGIVLYTILRSIVYVIFRVIPDGQDPVSFWVTDIIGASIVLFTINIIYARLFGHFFEALLQHGVAFNWWLFIIVSVVVYYVKTKLFGKTKHPYVLRVLKRFIIFVRMRKRHESEKENRQKEIIDRMMVKRSIKTMELEKNYSLI